jgi:O-antigen/teichoic acid export membrane protein
MPSPSSIPETEPVSDGRERFGRNVAFAWGGYMVNVISGFIVPRLISDQLGQVTLGVWDFAWSFVAYFGLVQLGMGGSISRYVAYYSSRNDAPGLNRSVSTIAIFQRAVGWLALVLAVVTAWWILPLFGSRLGDELGTARWVLLLLGTQIALGISLAAYPAVIVGYHRWDLHNTVSAVANALVAFGMVGILLLGGGLPALALVHCTIMVGGDVVRWRMVKRVCPELRIARRLASWIAFKEQARYSVKILIPLISNLLSNQAMCLLITAFLGPASLAVFSRSRGLMTALRTLAAKFGMIIIPTASALEAKNDRQALRATLLTTPAIISSLMLPVLIAIGVLGDSLIRLWMGEAYVLHGLVEILCVGTYFTLVQEPVWCLLAGMNIHGRVALAKLGAAAGSALLLTLGLWFLHWGLLGAAVCFALPQLLVDGLVTPWYACRVVVVSKRLFLWRVFVRPGLCAIPFGASMVVASSIFSTHPALAIWLGALGSVVTSLCYLKWLIPTLLRAAILNRIRLLFPMRSVGTSL